MCRPVTCKTCGKTTWAGCGNHVAQVKASVPAGRWCPGHPREESDHAGWRNCSSARAYWPTMPASWASSPAWVRLSTPSLSSVRDT